MLKYYCCKSVLSTYVFADGRCIVNYNRWPVKRDGQERAVAAQSYSGYPVDQVYFQLPFWIHIVLGFQDYQLLLVSYVQ